MIQVNNFLIEITTIADLLLMEPTDESDTGLF